MKVLQLISSSGYFGSDNMLIELANSLKSTAFSPVVGVFRNRKNPRLEVAKVARSCGIPVEIFPCSGRVDIRTVGRIRQYLRENEIDLVHTHGYKSNLYALCSSLGMRIGKVATCHNWLGDDIKMKSYARLDKFFLSRFDKVIAVSDSIRSELSAARVSPGKTVTIYNGIDLSRFQSVSDENPVRREFGIGEGVKVVGTVGRLSKEKGHAYFLQAAENLLQEGHNVVFLVVGDGPLRQSLEGQVSERRGRGSSIVFTGTRRDMENIYVAMDVFVLPSLTEGLPMALLEAIAARKPVVATRVGGVPSIIREGETGRLVEAGDVRGLTDAIRSVLTDPAKGRRMAEGAYGTVEKNFSCEQMVRGYVRVYEEVLKGAITKERGGGGDSFKVIGNG